MTIDMTVNIDVCLCVCVSFCLRLRRLRLPSEGALVCLTTEGLLDSSDYLNTTTIMTTNKAADTMRLSAVVCEYVRWTADFATIIGQLLGRVLAFGISSHPQVALSVELHVGVLCSLVEHTNPTRNCLDFSGVANPHQNSALSDAADTHHEGD